MEEWRFGVVLLVGFSITDKAGAGGFRAVARDSKTAVAMSGSSAAPSTRGEHNPRPRGWRAMSLFFPNTNNRSMKAPSQVRSHLAFPSRLQRAQ